MWVYIGLSWGFVLSLPPFIKFNLPSKWCYPDTNTQFTNVKSLTHTMLLVPWKLRKNKTIMCERIHCIGYCPHGKTCRFAHSEIELYTETYATANLWGLYHNAYRGQPCFTFVATGKWWAHVVHNYFLTLISYHCLLVVVHIHLYHLLLITAPLSYPLLPNLVLLDQNVTAFMTKQLKSVKMSYTLSSPK